MKTIVINVSYVEIHHQVCNLCAAYDWLQQVNPATGERFPLVTKDMFSLMAPHYKQLKDHAVSLLRGWVSGVTDNGEMGCSISLYVPPRVDEYDVENMLESYMVDATLRKYSHLGKKNAGSGAADETLYMLTAMMTPDDTELYDYED